MFLRDGLFYFFLEVFVMAKGDQLVVPGTPEPVSERSRYERELNECIALLVDAEAQVRRLKKLEREYRARLGSLPREV